MLLSFGNLKFTLAFSIVLLVTIELYSLHLKAENFSNVVNYHTFESASGFSSMAELRKGVQYGFVASAVFKHRFVESFKEKPVLRINGKPVKLLGGESVFENNLRLGFTWIDKPTVVEGKRFHK